MKCFKMCDIIYAWIHNCAKHFYFMCAYTIKISMGTERENAKNRISLVLKY